ncbi:unnamed protein product [Moneuplotes crassus]|uniref:AP2/ERF domain-containing protein n=1 Tax=Euplotes crassus TaxID=5936 RepID=A0AAD2D009_EUPCR|nr:unnamed protein product [Moneuplotes crassus]
MISSSHLLNHKYGQLSSIGLSICDLQNLAEIMQDSYTSKLKSIEESQEEVYKYQNTEQIGDLVNIAGIPAYAVAYNISPQNADYYNMGGFENYSQGQFTSYQAPNQVYVMNNILPSFYNSQHISDHEIPESTNCSKKTAVATSDDHKAGALPKTGVISGTKISLLRKVLEGIHDDHQILITSKPKNKSNKIRKSNRHSSYRGVSLNGKKWQVMIMGPMKKKYFGGITTEREAAVFYDKLSILTNGLAAKTNFNYRKSDLIKMMAELEYMESQLS